MRQFYVFRNTGAHFRSGIPRKNQDASLPDICFPVYFVISTCSPSATVPSKSYNLFFLTFKTWYSRNDCKPQSKLHSCHGDHMFYCRFLHAAYVGLIFANRCLLLAFPSLCAEWDAGHIIASVWFLILNPIRKHTLSSYTYDYATGSS